MATRNILWSRECSRLDRAVMGRLFDIWKSKEVDLDTKLLLYKSAVLSVLMYGQEGWYLTPRIQSKLKGWNARNLAIITGNEIAEESREPTVDILKMLKARRLRWVGHVLRAKETNLVRQVLMEMEQPYSPGSVLMNAPKHKSMAELVEMANNREEWRKMVRGLDSDSSVSSVYSRGVLREIRHSERIAQQGARVRPDSKWGLMEVPESL